MNRKISKDLKKIIGKGLQGSIDRQDEIFNKTKKQRLFERAKSLANH